MYNVMINTTLENENKTKDRKFLLSPKTYIQRYLYKDTCVSKKRRKVNNDDFRILNINEFEELLCHNYNVSQLKIMCKHYKYKVSGNKSELVKRLYNNMRLSSFAVKIQSIFRRNIVQTMMKLKNIQLLKDSTNDFDFLTLQPINQLEISQVICIRSGVKNHVYCFDICSLYNLFKEYYSSNKTTRRKNITHGACCNPFNRQPFPSTLHKNLYKIVKYTKLSGININIKIDNNDYNESLKKQNQFKAIELFQVIDTFGFITDSSWITRLNMYGLSKFVKELIDVWDYRAQLTTSTRHKIFPAELGYPFRISRHTFNGSIENVKKVILKKILKFITSGVDNQSQSLAVFYVLGALTIVSKSAAENLPWLFESFTQL
jgi:hypothetical protein